MILQLQRKWRSTQSVQGVLSVGSAAFFTLEPAVPIAAGSYASAIAISPRLSVLEGSPVYCPHLYSVPGFVDGDILMHWGNYPRDTQGCILVGLNRLPDFVGSTRVAFGELMAKLPPTFTTIVLDIDEDFNAAAETGHPGTRRGRPPLDRGQSS